MIRCGVFVLGVCVLSTNGIAAPAFSEAQIRASRVVHHDDPRVPTTPTGAFAGVDMMNIFILTQSRDDHLTILDGGRLVPIHRFRPRRATWAAPQLTPDGRYAFLASQDGWVSKFDIRSLKVVAEVRTGLQMRNVAVSGDGKVLAVANDVPPTLALLDADLNLLKLHAVTSKDGKTSSTLSTIRAAPPRQSFVAVLKDVPEVWEISYNPAADDVPVGMVHDFQYKEGAFIPGFLNPRRTSLGAPMGSFSFSPWCDELIGEVGGGVAGQVVNLDVRKKIATLQLPVAPQYGAGVSWQWGSKVVTAVPSLTEGVITFIDSSDWKVIKTLQTSGPVFALRSHYTTPYAWAVSATGKPRDTLSVIDKRTIGQVASIRADSGKQFGNLEFTNDGRHVVVTILGDAIDGGAIVAFDANTFKEVRRIPFDRADGLYNVVKPGTRPRG